MINKKTALTLLVLAAALAGATHANAGRGSVLLGGTGFADRCTDNGGQLYDIEGGHACELRTTLLECTFAGAYADCEWNGVQNKLEVVRVIGMIRTEGPSGGGTDAQKLGGGSGGGGGGGGGGIQQLHLPIKNNQ